MSKQNRQDVILFALKVDTWYHEGFLLTQLWAWYQFLSQVEEFQVLSENKKPETDIDFLNSEKNLNIILVLACSDYIKGGTWTERFENHYFKFQ